MNKVDQQFVRVMLQVEQSYRSLKKHHRIRVEQWTKKLCQPTSNPLWKKNRNNYAKLLLNIIHTGNLEEPFIKTPSQGPLPILPTYLQSNWTLKPSKKAQEQDDMEIPKNQPNLTQRVLNFLRKHKDSLEMDEEYHQIVQQLGGDSQAVGDQLKGHIQFYQRTMQNLIQETRDALRQIQN